MEQDLVARMATQAYDSAKSAHKRLDSLENEVKDIHELASAMSAMSEKVDGLSADVREMKAEVQKVSERPARWWDKLAAAAVGAAVSGIVAALLAQIIK